MSDTKKTMPDWMMRYVANIDTEESYYKFRNLSEEYYKKLDAPSGGTTPAQNLAFDQYNRVANDEVAHPKSEREEFEINEEYKKKSRKLAHNLGYGEEKPLEVMQENDPTVNNSHNLLSREDKIANTVHKLFAEENPERAARSKDSERFYRNLETQEYNGKFHQAKNSKKFEKTQDIFQEEILYARRKSNHPTEDDKDPDPDNNGSAKKSAKYEKGSAEEKKDDFKMNHIDISSNRMLKTYFESRGITQEMLDDLTSRESGFSEKKATKDKDDVENHKRTEINKSPMVDVYFKKHGIVINKEGNELPTFGATISNDNFSITYTKQFSGSDYKKKSRNMDKE